MALRLKRGTNAERLNYTPELGELIYVTDYSAENVSPLWIGDGSTVGGDKITGNGDTEVVSDTTPQLGGNLDINGFDIVGNGDIDTNGNVDITGNLLAGSITASSISGNFDGDLSGSVFGDDSTKIIDGVNNSINTNLITGSNVLSVDNGSGIQIKDVSDFARLSIQREDTDIDIGDPNVVTAYGTLRFERNDVNGLGIGVYVQGGSDGFKVFTLPDGSSFNLPNSIHLDMNGNFGIGKTPTQKLDVDGDIVSTGIVSGAALQGTLSLDDSSIIIDGINGNISTPGYVQFGSFSTTERNAISAENGMVIYNITDNRFQGYQAGSWINLDDGTNA